jgi:uncharacterized protein (DUF4415 family)
MSDKPMKKKSQTDWKYLAALTDDKIDVTDIPPLGADFWKRAKLRMPEKKDSVTIRLDHDVLTWFKKTGRGYQTRMNAVLRSYAEAHSEPNHAVETPPRRRAVA